MQQIDEARLETDSHYRFDYIREFIGFDDDDVAAIHASAGYLAPLIPEIVETTYESLLKYDCTARHFVPRQHGFEGDTPGSIADLSVNHEQIRFRKEHLSRYLMHLLGHAYNAKMADYLDMVGKMHTPLAGNKNIDVPLVQMNALMGLLADILIEKILEFPIDAAAKHRTLRAFQKLLWLQNDFINRHYPSISKN